MTHRRRIGWMLCAASLASIGCAHGHVTQQLHAARIAMDEARATGTAELEPAELADAERVLAVAEAQDDGSPREAHFAYVAERRAHTAMADARRDRIERDVALGTRDLEEAEVGLTTLDAEVLFAPDEAALASDASEVLEPIAEQLRAPGVIGVVTGFTDAEGTVAYNRDLSQRRADAVRAYLVEHGVPSARLVVEGRGEATPIASNATEEGRSLNRRVEVAIYPSAASVLPPARARETVASR